MYIDDYEYKIEQKIDQIIGELNLLGWTHQATRGAIYNFFTQESCFSHPFETGKILSAELKEQIQSCRNAYYSSNRVGVNLTNHRITLLRAIVDSLHKYYPEYKNDQPEINYADSLKGMMKIRVLVSEYLSKVKYTAGYFECNLLALMILKEKHSLKLTDINYIDQNQFATSFYGAVDCSRLDLSYMVISRDSAMGRANFKAMIFDYCNFEGTTLVNIEAWSTSVKECNLRGADFTTSTLEAYNHPSGQDGFAPYPKFRQAMSDFRIQEMWPKAVSVLVLKAEESDSPDKKIKLLEEAWNNYKMLKALNCYPDCFFIEDYLRIRLGATYASIGDLPNAYRCLVKFLSIAKVRQTLAELIIRTPALEFKRPKHRYALILMLLRHVPEKKEDQLMAHEVECNFKITDLDCRRMMIQTCSALLKGKPTLVTDETLEGLLGYESVESYHAISNQLKEVIGSAQYRLRFFDYYSEHHESPLTKDELMQVIDILKKSACLANPLLFLSKIEIVMKFISQESQLGKKYNNFSACTTLEAVILNSEKAATALSDFETFENQVFTEFMELLKTIEFDYELAEADGISDNDNPPSASPTFFRTPREVQPQDQDLGTINNNNNI